jgi:predicted nucleic acid-binding protein
VSTPRYLLDSNVLVRFLARDNSDQYQRASRLLAAAEAGECVLELTPWIVAEVVFVLTEVYGVPRGDVVASLLMIINGHGIQTQQADMVLDGLRRYAAKSVDFADALLAAQSAALGLRPASFDRDLDKFADIKRYEP